MNWTGNVTLGEICHEMAWTDTLPGNRPETRLFSEPLLDAGIPTVPYVSKADRHGSCSRRPAVSKGA